MKRIGRHPILGRRELQLAPILAQAVARGFAIAQRAAVSLDSSARDAGDTEALNMAAPKRSSTRSTTARSTRKAAPKRKPMKGAATRRTQARG